MSNDAVDFSVLIVCYRSRDLIGDCLRGIYQHTQGQFEVLLVDCSNDGTVDMVRSDYPQVRVIENSENQITPRNSTSVNKPPRSPSRIY